MSVFPKRRVPPLFRSGMVDDIEQQLAGRAIPGVHSSRILRRLQQELGVQKRDDLDYITRSSGGDPGLIAEGISQINRNTGRTFAGAAIDADQSEEQLIGDSLTRRLSVALQREGEQNQQNRLEAEAEYEQDRMAYDFILNLLGSGANLGGAYFQAATLAKILEEQR